MDRTLPASHPLQDIPILNVNEAQDFKLRLDLLCLYLHRKISSAYVLQYTFIIIYIVYLSPEEIADVLYMDRYLCYVFVQCVLPPQVVSFLLHQLLQILPETRYDITFQSSYTDIFGITILYRQILSI